MTRLSYLLADLLRGLSLAFLNVSHAVRYYGNRLNIKSQAKRYAR